MKQLIIARKDLDMSPGKLAAQVSHGSMAFLTTQIRQKASKVLKYPIRRHPSYVVEKLSDHESSVAPIAPTTSVRPADYRRSDLSQWAKDAFDRREMYFYTRPVPDQDDPYRIELCKPEYEYTAELFFDTDLYEKWIEGAFTKVICEAKNRTHLMKAVTHAEELGLKEGEDFFLINDNCLTELEPEEVDENGQGRTLTCIGFRPLPDDLCRQISRKYQLYK